MLYPASSGVNSRTLSEIKPAPTPGNTIIGMDATTELTMSAATLTSGAAPLSLDEFSVGFHQVEIAGAHDVGSIHVAGLATATDALEAAAFTRALVPEPDALPLATLGAAGGFLGLGRLRSRRMRSAGHPGCTRGGDEPDELDSEPRPREWRVYSRAGADPTVEGCLRIPCIVLTMSESLAANARRDSVALSIITPVLDGVAHIARCIASVRTHAGADYEHLIVDGGSTDGTLDIVHAAIATDQRIRLLTGPDRGQSHAMNKGVAAARGDMLGFLNVDDEYLAGGPALAVTSLRTKPGPGFFWGACEIDFQGDSPNWIQRPWRLQAWRLLAGWPFGPHPVNPSSYFYHRSLHDVAGPYREDEHYVMDLEFIARATPFLRSLLLSDQLIGRFRLAPGTKTHAYVRRPDRLAHEDRLLAPLRLRLSPWDRAKCESCRWARRTWRRLR